MLSRIYCLMRNQSHSWHTRVSLGPLYIRCPGGGRTKLKYSSCSGAVSISNKNSDGGSSHGTSKCFPIYSTLYCSLSCSKLFSVSARSTLYEWNEIEFSEQQSPRSPMRRSLYLENQKAHAHFGWF